MSFLASIVIFSWAVRLAASRWMFLKVEIQPQGCYFILQ